MILVQPYAHSRVQQGPRVEVTCEGLRVDENPLDGLTIFLAQLQIDLIGAVGLGPGGRGGRQGEAGCVRSTCEVYGIVICGQFCLKKCSQPWLL